MLPSICCTHSLDSSWHFFHFTFKLIFIFQCIMFLAFNIKRMCYFQKCGGARIFFEKYIFSEIFVQKFSGVLPGPKRNRFTLSILCLIICFFRDRSGILTSYFVLHYVFDRVFCLYYVFHRESTEPENVYCLVEIVSGKKFYHVMFFTERVPGPKRGRKWSQRPKP